MSFGCQEKIRLFCWQSFHLYPFDNLRLFILMSCKNLLFHREVYLFRLTCKNYVTAWLLLQFLKDILSAILLDLTFINNLRSFTFKFFDNSCVFILTFYKSILRALCILEWAISLLNFNEWRHVYFWLLRWHDWVARV